MITLRSIKVALTARLKTKYPDYEVHFDNVDKTNGPYFYVSMLPTVTTVDEVYSDRLIQVEVTFFMPRDKFGRVDRMRIYDVADGLDILFRPVVRIEDRAITIPGAELTTVDDILHYIFSLDFRDCLTDEEAGRVQYELMQTLQLTLNNTNMTEED